MSGLRYPGAVLGGLLLLLSFMVKEEPIPV
jgi:hypothetical protein